MKDERSIITVRAALTLAAIALVVAVVVVIL